MAKKNFNNADEINDKFSKKCFESIKDIIETTRLMNAIDIQTQIIAKADCCSYEYNYDFIESEYEQIIGCDKRFYVSKYTYSYWCL